MMSESHSSSAMNKFGISKRHLKNPRKKLHKEHGRLGKFWSFVKTSFRQKREIPKSHDT